MRYSGALMHFIVLSCRDCQGSISGLLPLLSSYNRSPGLAVALHQAVRQVWVGGLLSNCDTCGVVGRLVRSGSTGQGHLGSSPVVSLGGVVWNARLCYYSLTRAMIGSHHLYVTICLHHWSRIELEQGLQVPPDFLQTLFDWPQFGKPFFI